MNILCFFPRHLDCPVCSASFIESLDAAEHIDVHRQCETLAEALTYRTIAPDIVLLVVPDRATLRQLVDMQDLLSGMKIVLVLPEGSPRTLALAHMMRPRYIGFIDSGLLELRAVLDRLMASISGGEAQSDSQQQGM